MSKKIFSYEEISLHGHVFDAGELIQIDTEKNLDHILGTKKESIRNIIVVGAWRGNEVASFLRFPNATIYCFEPNKENYDHLVNRWGSNKRVVCFNVACAAYDGEAELHEANLTGNDSLLSISQDPNTNLQLIKKHIITTKKLDSIEELQDKEVDLLWADTQGYELEVLKGATNILTKTRALFLEVYRGSNKDYNNGAKYEDVITYLDESGFMPIAEGLDQKVGGGNALFIRKDLHTKAFYPDVYTTRILASLTETARKKSLLQFKIIQWILVKTPVKIKTFIRKLL